MAKLHLLQNFFSKRKSEPSFREVSSGQWDLRTVTELFASELEELGKIRTARAYRTVCRGITEFSMKERLPISDLTPSFLLQYQRYMSGKGNSLNTISFYMRNLRAIYNKGVCRGLYPAPCDPLFKNVYTGVCKTAKRAVNARDVALMEKKARSLLPEVQPTVQKATGPVARKRISPVWVSLAYFLFCFYARGMCFVDMAFLKKSDIREGHIYYKRQKTGQLVVVKLNRDLEMIIDRFSPLVKDSEYVFPVITDPSGNVRLQYENGLRLQNRRLKQVAYLCGIGQKLSTHVARHTWATLAKSQHIPLPVISESLGHTSLHTTSIYLDSFESAVLDRANHKVCRAVKKMI